ncbi:hypothetical protein DXG03_008198 [Asterophora parasitica]|uniref:Uncharacterized protein n=1 Tax=Asterophora parasitica TaxID=117018 RepID=A0A9P7G6P1_9AGAR|nr:hypothetical protein DXG03_008198 [Asterophora parasitica]
MNTRILTHNNQFVADQIRELWNSRPSSPATSSSTLISLEDQEVKGIFISQIPNSLAPPTDIFASNYSGATPDLSSLRNPLPEDDLNPNATPFIPKLAPKLPRKTWRLMRPSLGTELKPRMSKWLRNFNIGTRPPIVENELHSLIIVASEQWDPQPMAELAQEFCWRAAEAAPEELEAVVTFLLKLHTTFQGMKSREAADAFEWHIKECFMGTFFSVWDPVSAYAPFIFDLILILISREQKINPEAVSYNVPRSVRHIECATQLATVIGELYAKDFFDVKNVTDCLETLVSNFVSVEHADALATMIRHAGRVYWFSHPDGPVHLERFRTAFAVIANKLEGKMSVLNAPRSQEALFRVLEPIDRCCKDWSREMLAHQHFQMSKQPPRQPELPVIYQPNVGPPMRPQYAGFSPNQGYAPQPPPPPPPMQIMHHGFLQPGGW